jgi:hypothetical protein
MIGGITGAVVALLAFGLTFAVVRLVVNSRRKRRIAQARKEALHNQSRQVRRAEARRHKA